MAKRLIHTNTVDLIYKGYHEKDADINDPIFLASCTVGIMTLQEVKEFVESDEFLDEVIKKSKYEGFWDQDGTCKSYRRSQNTGISDSISLQGCHLKIS